jgi:hypothetical protein
VSSYAATSGRESRLRHGNRIVGQQLTLSYDNITEAEWLQLRAHYLAHEPIRRSFNLPAAVLDGESSDQFEAEGYSWIYAGQPETDDTQPDIHSVAITIERIPEPAPEGWPLTSLPAISTTAGRVARILYGRILSGQAASLTATGQAGQLRHAKVIRGQAAASVTTGQAAGLTRGKQIIGEAAAMTTTGQAAGLTRGKQIIGEAAAFTTTGQAADLLHGKVIIGEAAAFITTGQDADLTKA